jgi:hypothetical protein
MRTGGPVPRSELVWSIQYQLCTSLETKSVEEAILALHNHLPTCKACSTSRPLHQLRIDVQSVHSSAEFCAITLAQHIAPSLSNSRTLDQGRARTNSVSAETLITTLDTEVGITGACLHTSLHSDVSGWHCKLLVVQCFAVGGFEIATQVLYACRVANCHRWVCRLVEVEPVRTTTDLLSITRARLITATTRGRGASIQVISAVAFLSIFETIVAISSACFGAALVRHIGCRDWIFEVC